MPAFATDAPMWGIENCCACFGSGSARPHAMRTCEQCGGKCCDECAGRLNDGTCPECQEEESEEE